MAARNGNAILAGVIGYPISHSLSPALHEYWLREYNINGAYVPLSITPEQFISSIKTLTNIGFKGFNITLPHKETAWDTVDVRDAATTVIGAVNTITVKDGLLYGSNTDAYGFMQHLQSSAKEPLQLIPLTKRNALIIGAGGASRAVCVGLITHGCKNLTICNRNIERAEHLKKLLTENYSDSEIKIHVVPWSNLQSTLSGETTLLINTTQLGMKGQPPLEINLSTLPPPAIVADIVYKPIHTPLLLQAKTFGLHAVDGIGMLLWQAQAGFEQWFGVTPEVTPQLRDYMLSLAEET